MSPPSSSLSLLLTLGAAQLAASTPYTLQDTYDASNFFDAFRWWVTPDPTNGFVDYQSRENATAAGLARIVGGGDGGETNKQQVYLGVDTDNTYPVNDSAVRGRPSVRLESMKLYNHMLMVADIEHMPTGCGAWPALWTYGNVTWPDQGEIDSEFMPKITSKTLSLERLANHHSTTPSVLEGVNSMTNNWMTLHTTPGCSFRRTGAAQFFKTANCNAKEGKDGCPQRLASSSSSSNATTTTTGQAVANYGEPFNAGRGGAYIMEWTSTDVHVWFLPRDNKASSLFQTLVTAGPASLDTTALGTPLAGFSSTGSGGGSVNSTEGLGSCDVDAHFYDHTITIDTTFCGDWAGSDEGWGGDAACGRLAGTCAEWVANNPQAFREAYWLFNSIRVYSAASGSSSAVGRREGSARGSRLPVYRSG